MILIRDLVRVLDRPFITGRKHNSSCMHDGDVQVSYPHVTVFHPTTSISHTIERPYGSFQLV